MAHLFDKRKERVSVCRLTVVDADDKDAQVRRCRPHPPLAARRSRRCWQRLTWQRLPRPPHRPARIDNARSKATNWGGCDSQWHKVCPAITTPRRLWYAVRGGAGRSVWVTNRGTGPLEVVPSGPCWLRGLFVPWGGLRGRCAVAPFLPSDSAKLTRPSWPKS